MKPVVAAAATPLRGGSSIASTGEAARAGQEAVRTRAAAQGAQRIFTGPVTSVKDKFCFLESRPGVRCMKRISVYFSPREPCLYLCPWAGMSVFQSIGACLLIPCMSGGRGHCTSGGWHARAPILSDTWAPQLKLARTHSNVYMPAQVADPSMLRVGDVVTVSAKWDAFHKNFRACGVAIRDNVPILPRKVAPDPNGRSTSSPATPSQAQRRRGADRDQGGRGRGGAGAGDD